MSNSCNPMDCSPGVARNPWIEVPLFMGFPRQEYWSGLPFPSPGDLPDPWIVPMSPALASQFLKTATWEAQIRCLILRPNKMIWGRRAGREWAIAIVKVPQSCLTLCDPVNCSCQAPLSMEFSRQEHWSGLPFPSQMHESEKWKWNSSVVSDS